MCRDGELLPAHSIRVTALIDLATRIKPTCSNPSFSCGRMKLAFPASMAPTMMCSPDEAAGFHCQWFRRWAARQSCITMRTILIY